MTPFEAVSHAMTTIATAGFSTSDASLGHFRSPAIEWTATVFMIVGSIPFMLYFLLVSGRRWALWRDAQVRWFLGLLLIAVIVMTGWLWLARELAPLTALRYAAFNTVSVITGTGYASADYGAWGGFAVTLLLFVMIIGGCSGSTTGGIKVFRFQMLYAMIMVQIRRLLQPHGVFVAHYNRKPIPDAVADAVMSFFFLFGLTYGLVALILSALGLDFITAMSGAASAIANVGPGLGDIIGPAGTYAPLPDAAKWLLSIAMLLGRLEFFTVLALFTSRYWQG